MGKGSKKPTARAQVVAPPSAPLPTLDPPPVSETVPEAVTLPVPEIPPPPAMAAMAARFRNRIVEMKMVPARSIKVHPKNWRTHPETQAKAMEAVLERIGFAAALIVSKLADGTYQLIDGHLRHDLADDSLVPVIITDLTEREADEMLATFDHLSSLAVPDKDKLKDLLSGLNAADTPLLEMGYDENHLARLIDPDWQPPSAGGDIKDQFQVLVECETEQQQAALLEELTKRGLKVRSLMS